MSDELKKLKVEVALQELADSVPVDLMRPGPVRYAPLRITKRGSWRSLLHDLEPFALVWTDWEDGFDVIHIGNSAFADQLENYVITSKALDIPAGWAYTSLDAFVKRFGDEDVRVSDQKDGKLIGALNDSRGSTQEDSPETGEEDGTEERV